MDGTEGERRAAIGPWLPAQAAPACDSCTHPVVRPAIKHALTGTW